MDYQICYLKNEEEFIEFEKGLYTAFTKIGKSKYREENYKIIDGNRYQNPVPYENQKIYAIKENNQIITAISIRTVIEENFLLESLGFEIPENHKNDKSCEGLDFFSLATFGIDSIDKYQKFLSYVLKDLKDYNFKYWYGSLDSRLKIMYREIDVKFLQEITFNNRQKEILFRVDL